MNGKNKYLSFAAIYAVFFLTSGLGIVNPAIQSIAEAFPDLPLTTIMMISTLPSLFLIPATIITGALAGDKVKFKTLAVIGIIVFIIAGVAPAFLNNFSGILVSRAFIGIGVGIAFTISSSIVLRLFEGPQQGNILGVGNVISSLANVLFALVAGVLVSISWNSIFYIHLVGVVALILVILGLPEPEKITKTSSESGPKGKISIGVYILASLAGISMLLVYPLMTGISTIVVTKEFGTAAAAGLALSFLTVGGMIGNSFFGKLHQKLKKFTLTFDFIVVIIGLAVVYYAFNIIVIYIGMVIIGIGFMLVVPTLMMDIGSIVSPERIPLASSFVIAFMNIGAFLSPYYINLIGSITGVVDVNFVIFASLVLFIVMAVVYTIIQMFQKKSIKSYE
ncbi:MFS transporter [Acetobacterium fimetarium]|jgi:Arabinose efflux permease|uniref:MFS transporter n=1 Tax=Acetobacterium fimetarium TaxID=52691 RepID=A0ABR6WS56_9FIRM|nr:MFS transporter [Acetobacterium fimetarium]MBC3803372.1 MFS transporter [Acetobacterium fimetarium]